MTASTMFKMILPLLTVAASFVFTEALWFIQYHPSNNNVHGRQRPSTLPRFRSQPLYKFLQKRHANELSFPNKQSQDKQEYVMDDLRHLNLKEKDGSLNRIGHKNYYEWYPERWRWHNNFTLPWRHFTMIDYQRFYGDILNQDEYEGRLGLLNWDDNEGKLILFNQNHHERNYEGQQQNFYPNLYLPSERSYSSGLKHLKQKGIEDNLNQIGQVSSLNHLHKDDQVGSIYNLNQNNLDGILKSHEDNFIPLRQNNHEDNFNYLSQKSKLSQHNHTLPWSRKGHGSPDNYNPYKFAQSSTVSPWTHFTFTDYLVSRRGPWMPITQSKYENAKDPDLLKQTENIEDYQPKRKNHNQLNQKRNNEET